MKNIFLIIASALLINLPMNGQKSFYLNGDLVMPGLQMEYNFNKQHALNLNGYYYPHFFNHGEGDMLRNSIKTNLQYRYYYNDKKRSDKGFNTAHNANNYFAISYNRIQFLSDKTFESNAINSINLGWGWKRNIRNSNWYYGAEIGVSIPIAYNQPRPFPTPYANLKLGYMLYKKDFSIGKPREIMR